MKILFITNTRIGDAVLSTGLLDHLARRHPEARVTVACGVVAAPLFKSAPNVETVIPMVKGRHARHWRQLWLRTVRTRWDAVIDLRRSALGYFLLARRRLRGRALPAPAHRVEENAAVLGLEKPPAPRLWTTAAHRAAAGKLVPPGGPVLAVAPCANWIGKTWPADRFRELVKRLTAPEGILPGARVAVFGAGEEREQAQPLLSALPAERVIDLVGGHDLLTVHACLERCDFFVGNDSALMHMSAAAGTPTLGLFGPSKDVHYAPWGAHCGVVRTDASYEEIFPDDPTKTTASLMGSLSVYKAEQAARGLWRRLQHTTGEPP